MLRVQLSASSKRPSDYLSELPPPPPSRLPEGGLLASLVASKAAALAARGTTQKQAAEAYLRASGLLAGAPGVAEAGEGVTAPPSLSSLLPDPCPTDALDASRLTLPAPAASARGDPAAWRAAVETAFAQLEHQRARLLALEVAGSRGTDAWRARAEALETQARGLEREEIELDKELQSAHRDRRMEQEAAGSRLGDLESEARRLWLENARIQAAAWQLERAREGRGGEE